MGADGLEVYRPLLFAVIGYLLVSYFLAWATGWRRIRARFRPEIRLRRVAGTRTFVAFRAYWYPVRIRFGPEHLYVRMWRVPFPVFLFHPPIQVPYADIVGIEYESMSMRLVMLDVEGVTIKAGIGVGMAMEKASAGTWQFRRYVGPSVFR